MAVATLTVFRTFQACIVAFAVFFLAKRFFASTLTSRYICRDTFEVVRLSIVHNTSRTMNLLLISWVVMATNANAVLIAHFPFGETLAVKFETVDFGAFTSRTRMLAR
jgi:hypothetical protein